MDRRSSRAGLQPISHRSDLRSELDEKSTLDGATPSPQLSQDDGSENVRRQKITQIEHACNEGNIAALVNLAKSREGFIEDAVRRAACT